MNTLSDSGYAGLVEGGQRRGEREKHARHLGQRLSPFVVEPPGRIGAEARFRLLTQIRELPNDTERLVIKGSKISKGI